METFIRTKFSIVAVMLLFAMFLTNYGEANSSPKPKLSSTATSISIDNFQQVTDSKKTQQNQILDGEVVLWEQMNWLYLNEEQTQIAVYRNQDLETALNNYDSFSADDFTINNEKWSINKIQTVFITYNDGYTNAHESVHIRFYSDDNGNIGDLIAEYLFLDYYITGGYITNVELPSSLVLEPGNYWIVLQGQMNYADYGLLALPAASNNIGNYEYGWRNPGGAWEKGTDWLFGEDVASDTHYPYNWNFALIGEQYLDAPTLSMPWDGTADESINPELYWEAGISETYDLQVSRFENFSVLAVNQTGLTDNYYFVGTNLLYNTEYYWRVRAVTGDVESDWSEVWTFTTMEEPVLDDYCEAPTWSQWMYINGVYFGDIANNTDWQSEVGIYTDMETDIIPGEYYELMVTVEDGDELNNVMAWVDWNKNGEYGDTDDEIYYLWSEDGGFTFFGEIYVPADANLGLTRMRVRLMYDETPYPCGEAEFGETEDYAVRVLIPVIPGPELISPEHFAVNVNPMTTAQWSSVNGVDSYNIQVSTNSDFTNIILDDYTGGPAYSFSFGQLQYSTSYYWRVQGNFAAYNTLWSDTYRFTTMVEPEEYCPASTVNEDEWIEGVEFGDIANYSDWQDGVADYTYLSTDLYMGESYNMTVINGNGYVADRVTVWVDWNQDFELDNDTERFDLVSTDEGWTYNGDITVPDHALRGTTRMRVRMVWNTTAQPCGSSNYGEVEDYSVNVVDGLIAYAPEMLFPMNNANDVPLLANFQWEENAVAEYYTIQIASDANMNNIVYEETMLMSGETTLEDGVFTHYEEGFYWRVRLEAGGETSPWSEPWAFSTMRIPAPNLLSPTAGATNVSLTPTLSFNTLPYADSYSIYIYSGDIVHMAHNITANPGESVVTYNVPFAALNQYSHTYSWFAVAHQNGWSSTAWWEGQNFTTIPLPAPQLVAPANGATEVSLTPMLEWNSVDFVDYYILNIYKDGSVYMSVEIDAADFEQGENIVYNIMNELDYYSVYSWDVTVYVGPFSATSAEWSFRTEIFPSPELIMPANMSMDNSLTPEFSWTTLAGAASYTLYIWDADGNLVYENEMTPEMGDVMSFMLPEMDRLVMYEHAYTWQISVNKEVVEVYSDIWEFTTLNVPNTALYAPMNMAMNVNRETTFEFAAVDLATHYILNIYDSEMFEVYSVMLYADDFMGMDVIEHTLSIENALDYYADYSWSVQVYQNDVFSGIEMNSFTTGKAGGAFAINIENIAICKNTNEIYYLGTYKNGNSTTATGGSGNYTYHWSPTAGLNFAEGMSNPRVNPLATITYTLKVTDTQSGNIVTTQVTVTVNPEPKIIMSALIQVPAFEMIENLNDFATIQDVTGFPMFSWVDVNGFSVNPENYMPASGMTRLYLTVADEAGCMSKERRTILYAPFSKDGSSYDVVSGQNNSSLMWAYPTIVTDVLNIHAIFTESGEGTLRVLDLSGKEVLQSNINTSEYYETTLNLNELTNGVYFVIIDTAEDSIVYKVIKQ